MPETIIYLDPESSLNLQTQIRQKLVEGILSGALPPGHKLPSSRKFAQQLSVARNTVVLAYQQLVAEGYLVSRERSGIFVNEEMLDTRVGYSSNTVPSNESSAAAWRQRTKRPVIARRAIGDDWPNWNRYPYPFIDGKFDASLFPLAEWREASRLALAVADVNSWSTDSGDADDPMLIDEIRSKILTRRGIQARSDEIMITMGTQNSLYIVCRLLADSGVNVAMEDPGNIGLRGLLQQNAANVVTQPVDSEGMVIDERLTDCDIVYVTPSHQIPTAVTMTTERRTALLAFAERHDLLIVEDDYESEINYLDHPLPALRSMDETGRVIYVGSLSQVLAPGLRTGFIVADSQFIQRARALRRTIMKHPPLNNQRAAAYFLSLGHYDALMLRLHRVLQERRLALRDALNWMRGVPIEITPEVGGTTYWVRAPENFDVDALAHAAAQRGILIEPVKHYYSDADSAENSFRMGITSLPVDKIRPGVTRLVDVIRSQVKGQVETLTTTHGTWLRDAALEEAMSGATILYQEVYGAPCTIRCHTDGRMTGVLGFSNEEQDIGSWRILDDVFYRRWSRWNYGEEKGYSIVLDGEQIKYFNEDGQIVDSAFIYPGTNAISRENKDLPAWSIMQSESGPI